MHECKNDVYAMPSCRRPADRLGRCKLGRRAGWLAGLAHLGLPFSRHQPALSLRLSNHQAATTPTLTFRLCVSPFSHGLQRRRGVDASYSFSLRNFLLRADLPTTPAGWLGVCLP